MAWFPASLIKTHRRLSACATTMSMRLVYGRRRENKAYSSATFNSNKSVVYGQKHKVWVLVFLVRMSRTFLDKI